MPVYNNAPYLEEAIRSILNQTYGNFEFIILADASSPFSLLRRLLYTRNFVIYLNGEPTALSSAWNANMESMWTITIWTVTSYLS
jgi:glycosyltransferase involved in cell wall biosynthesis